MYDSIINYALAVIVALLMIMSLRLNQVLPKKLNWDQELFNSHKPRQPHKTVIVLGSGGHTQEIFDYFRTLDLQLFSPRTYLVAETDAGPGGSENKAIQFENSLANPAYKIRKIYRSREVGQSYITSIFTTLKSLKQAFRIIWQERPDVLLTNGPGTCVPFCFVAFLYRFFGIKWTCVAFIESFACVTEMSLSGKLVYPITDCFCVQWKELQNYYRAHYVGRIEQNQIRKLSQALPSIELKSYVFVTVGSTSFDPLIQKITDLSFLQVLKDLGFSGIHVQYGRGNIPSTQLQGFQTVYFAYKESIKEEIFNASFVISHAGAGTIRETLGQRKPLLVVPNTMLMNNHQLQLAKKLAELDYLFYQTLSELTPQSLKQIITSETPLLAFPSQETSSFAEHLKNFLS